MLRTADLEYDLPEDRIARLPAEPRDSARLMVVKRSDAAFIEHTTVYDLPKYLLPCDCLVLNTTRVLPARLQGVRTDTGGRVEGLYLSPAAPVAGGADGPYWRVLLQGKRMRQGGSVTLHTPSGADSGLRLFLEAPLPDEMGGWRVRLDGAGAATDEQVLARIGLTPIPPYIRRARDHAGQDVPDDLDRARYQTVFASDLDASHARHTPHPVPASPLTPGTFDDATAGSVAAPTAGLHLTPDLLTRLASLGVRRADVTLHVGTGTFRNVESEFVEQHTMHRELCELPPVTRAAILETRSRSGRVVCVGTTSARTVESFARLDTADPPQWLATDILITPGYQWRWADGLLTNFHLPRSTLMAMVASLLGSGAGQTGVERLKSLYVTAIREGYRFYSYGDAMLILP